MLLQYQITSFLNKMFEKYLQKILKEVLGEFIEEIDSKELSFGIWSGKIDIKNLKLKKNILQKYHLPIIIKHSCIRGLSLKIPWKNLFGSPLVITIESVLVLCQFANESINGEQRINAMIELINNTIKLVGEELVEKAKEKSQLKKKSGLIDQLTYKMLDNLYLSVKNIHLRFEEKDTGGPLKYGYSFGCSLQSIEVFAVGPNNEKVFIDRNKLQMSQTLLRKKIEMKNLSVYCNYGELDFITDITPNKNQKAIEQKLLKSIYTRQKFNSNQNKNNYILIMNVLGVMDEDHRQAIINYDFKLNFEKLIVKLDKQVLNCILTFVYKLKQLNTKYRKEIIRKQLSKQDDHLFRKYCNGYISDFKAKDYWNAKDKQLMNCIIVNLHESIIIQKIKYIVINQMSVTQLAKFFAVKGQDLDKGLLEVSKEIKDLEQPKSKMQILIPQITLYLVNQFSESILQLNVLSISLSYYEKIVTENKVKFIDFYIHNISAVNNSLYILSADQQAKNDKFLTCNLQITPEVTNINGKISSFNFYYDFETIFKINELFHLKEVQNKYRNMALDKIEEIQSKVSTKIKDTSTKMNVKFIICRPKVNIREGKVNWTISINQIQCTYAQQITLSLQSFKIVIYHQKEQYLFIQPFDIASSIQFFEQQSKVNLTLSPIAINFEFFIYSSLNNLNKYLFINKKNEIINKCNKSCEIFLKQNRWKKCFITLLDNHLYAWQNENEYPLFNIRIRFAEKVKRGKIDILEISDKKKVYQIAFKDEKLLEEWLKELKDITMNSSEQKKIEIVEVYQDSKLLLDIFVQNLLIRLNHHQFNKAENEFKLQKSAITTFQLHSLKANLSSITENNIKSSSVKMILNDLKFNQNKQDFITKLNPNESIMNLQVLSSTTSALSENANQIISLQLRSFQFYYKPSSILKLLGFFNDMESKNQIPDLNYEETLQQLNPLKILTQINTKIIDVVVILQNKINQMPMAKLKAAEIKIQLQIKFYETIISGKIQGIKAFDLTNYPYTLYTKTKKEVTEKQIVLNNGQVNSIDLKIQFLQQGSPNIKDEVKSMANVTINNLKINFTNEIVMRIIDYINNQILGLVCYPDFYPEFYCQDEQHKEISYKNFLKSENELFRLKFLNKLGKEKVKLMLQTSKPLMFNIQLNNSILNVVGDHSSSNGLSFSIEKALISNVFQQKMHSTNQGKLSIAHDIYLIELKNIIILLKEEGRQYQISNRIDQQQVWLKVKIDFFGGAMDYKFLDSNLELDNQISVDVEISIAKLHLNENILANVLKVINRNILQQDGVNFLMVYEIFEGCQSLLDVNIHSQLLIIELQLLAQKDYILTEMGGFLYKYDRNHSFVSKVITSKYIIFNFVAQNQQFKEVLTSRKIFGRVSNRGTFYTELMKENLLINLSQDTSFQYESIHNRKANKIESVLSAKELMAIINIDFIIYLQKVQINQEQVQSIPPVYHTIEEQLKQEIIHETTQIKLDKILICCQVVQSDIIMSLLSTIYITFDNLKTQIFIPDLQAFISGQEHITCNQLSEMKKRTLLKQTHLKIIKQDNMTEINLGKCFFKISINDIKSLHQIYTEVNQKYNEFARRKRASHLFSKEVESVEYLSQSKRKQEMDFKKGLEKQKLIDAKISKKLEANVEKIKTNKTNFKQRQVIPLQTSMQINLIGKQKQNSPASLSPKSSAESMGNLMTYNIDTIQLMIVDDLNDFLTPLIYINLKLDLNLQKKAAIELYADYFNLRNTLWQPIIQKSTLLIDYDNNITIKSVQIKEYININIASNFIQNIFKTINHKELKSSRLFYTSHKVDKDEINSWIVINELGEDIQCQSLSEGVDKNIFVGRGEAQTLSFLSKAIIKQFKQNENEQIYMKLIIGEKLTIKKLKINELGLKKITITNGDSNPIIIIKNLYIDLSKNIKYLTLSSQIIFQNKSDITIRLKESKYNRNIYLLPFKAISLPYYCNLHSVIYSNNEDDEHYQNFNNLEHCSKLEINNKLFNVSFSNKKLKKYFMFIPLYKITNYLPFVIVINFKEKNSNSLYCSLQLSSYENQSSNYGYLYKSLEELQASIWIENYQYTEFFTLKKYIEVRDYNNNILTIKSEVYKDTSSPMIHIALMVNYIVRNQTKVVFDAFVDNHFVNSIKQGQYFISQKNQINLILNGQKSDTIFLTKKFSCVSLRNKGNEIFKTESDYCLYKNHIQFDLSNENRINFYISEVLPMYTFKNENKYAIILKQNGSDVGQSQLIQAKAEQNIEWFIDSTNKRRNPLFKFTIQDSTYDWSCLINIQAIKKSYFVIRNKFNYVDIKYFVVNVKKIKEAYEINCKELSPNQIPYVIRNSTEKYNIFIENLKIILKPSDQSFFCWEDPSINQKKIKIKLYKSGLSLHKDGLKSKNKQDLINYEIKVDCFEQQAIKSHDQNLDIEVINLINRQVYVFSDAPKDGIETVMMNAINVELPIRIAFINNSTSPASHIFDLTTFIKLHYETYSTNKMVAMVELNQIQLDNQTKPLTYFPVVLSTNLQIRIEKAKNLQVELRANSIRVSIQENFITDLIAFLTYLQSLTVNQSSASNVLEQQAKQQTFFISKLILPKIAVELEIQTKKFSIQTTINLQKPEITSYPWKNIPYPIKTIAFNILSHLSISPWAFISSFGKGLSMLITEQETSKGFEGFFQQLIGGFSNSINGMIGMIVGHDIEKVDNFVDGCNKGLWAFGTSLYQILPNFEGDYSPINIIKEVGTSAISLVFKPVTGILRMTLRISEGIKKTTKFEFDFTSKKFKKRFPIVFYYRQQTFYSYDLGKSELINTIKRSLMNELKYFYLIDTIPIEYKLRNEKFCLIIGAQELLLFNIKTQKMIWKLQIQKISNIQIHNLCTIQFLVHNRMEAQEHRKKYEVDINSQESVKKVMETIEKIKKLSSIQL